MKKSILIACIALMCANIAQAQKTTRYEGAMALPSDLLQMSPFLANNKGEGYYDYYENTDGDRVKHGKFAFKVKQGTAWNVLSGQYTHGKKTGLWTVKDSLPSKQYIKHALHDVTASYENDSLNSFVYQKFKSGHYYTLECSFKNGRMIGDVTITFKPDPKKNNISKLQGKIGEDGLPIGVWIVTDNIDIEVTQKRLYVQGICVYVEERNQSTGERYSTYSVFEGVKKMPELADFNISTINGETFITYNGQTAKKERFENNYETQANARSLAKCEVYTLINNQLPIEGWREEGSILGNQMNSWWYHYSLIK